MPLDKLQKQILDDAKRKADEMRAEAEKRAAAILKEAEAMNKAEEDELEEELMTETARAQEERKANAELQERGVLLDARNKVVESLLPKVRSMAVKNVREKGYGTLINRAIQEASGVLPQQELTLTISKKDAGLVKRFGGKIKYGNVGNGVLLENSKGSVSVLVTIEKLFEKNRPEIETLLINEVFANKLEQVQKPANPKKASKPAAKKMKKVKKSRKAKGKK